MKAKYNNVAIANAELVQ